MTAKSSLKGPEPVHESRPARLVLVGPGPTPETCCTVGGPGVGSAPLEEIPEVIESVRLGAVALADPPLSYLPESAVGAELHLRDCCSLRDLESDHPEGLIARQDVHEPMCELGTRLHVAHQVRPE